MKILSKILIMLTIVLLTYFVTSYNYKKELKNKESELITYRKYYTYSEILLIKIAQKYNYWSEDSCKEIFKLQKEQTKNLEKNFINHGNINHNHTSLNLH